MRKVGRAVCLLGLSLLVSCTSQPISPPSLPLPEVPETPTAPVLRTEYGLASWYGQELQGRRTASGERFDSGQLTAAHRTAPFHTSMLVTYLANGRTVRVRINDRGPAIRGRLIDLSYGAALALDMLRAGVAQVQIDWLGDPASIDHNKNISQATDDSGGIAASAELYDPPRFLDVCFIHTLPVQHLRGPGPLLQERCARGLPGGVGQARETPLTGTGLTTWTSSLRFGSY